MLLLLIACDSTPVTTPTDTGEVVDEGWGDSDTQEDSDTEDTNPPVDSETGDTSADSGDTADSGTDTGTTPTLTACQTLMVDAGYPVFLGEGDTLVVTLNGATYPYSTVSWTSADGNWHISCGEIIGQSAATMTVEPTSPYGASTFTTDSSLCESPDPNTGWCWFHESVTGASLGGVTYHVTGEDESSNAILTQDSPPPPAK